MSRHSDAVAIAAHEIGVREEPMGSNSGRRVREYQAATFVPGTGWPWCAGFCCYVWEKAGKRLPYRTASAYGMLTWARGAGWAKRGRDCVPGDLVVFNIGSGHIAILEHRVGADGLVHTIDGNSSDQVVRRTRPYSLVAGGVHIPEIISTPVPKAKQPFWVVTTSEKGHTKRVFTGRAAQSKVMGPMLSGWLKRHQHVDVKVERAKGAK